MDLRKLNLFKSGMTEEEKEQRAKHEAVEEKFKMEIGTVQSTMATKGYSIILDKILDDMESAKIRLCKCSKKEFDRLQLEIKVRKEFLDKWSPYVD